MIIQLNKNFYNKEVVEQGLCDFKEVCDGKFLGVDLSADKLLIELVPKQDVEFLKEEFCNYVLGLMKNNNFI